MKIRYTGAAVTLALHCALGGYALAGCVLGRIAELPVTMRRTQPTIAADINGTATTFLIDSGAAYSLLSAAKAAELRLRLEPAPFDLQVTGVGGSQRASVATVSDFTLTHADLRGVQFIVTAGRFGAGLAGVIGQNILRIADTEYDLAHGVVRIWRPHGCTHSVLAYWARNQPYSVIDIGWSSSREPYIVGPATLNGTRIDVIFDTGSATSVVSLTAAEGAGFKRAGPGVERAGFLHGVGPDPLQTWIGTFHSLTIGGETIRNARLRVADIKVRSADMLLGADFFLANRIYVAVSQRKLYFTYNGGPIFSVAARRTRTSASTPQRTAPALPAASAHQRTAPATTGGAQPAVRAEALTPSSSSSRRGPQ